MTSARKLVIGIRADSPPIRQEVSNVADARRLELVKLPIAEACRLLRWVRRKEANAILHVTC